MKTFNFWRTLLLSALAVTAFASCSDSEEPGSFNGIPSITVNGAASASVGHDLSGGFTSEVSVVSAGPWTMVRKTADAAWCTPTVMSGQGGTTVVKFEVAASSIDRQAEFTLTAMGMISGIAIPRTATITVMQNAGGSTEVDTNVAEIRLKMKALATATAVEITEDLTLTGIVVSDVASGGFAGNKNCALVDNSSAEGAGILVRFNPEYKFTVGQVITGSIKGAKVALSFGVIQIEADAAKFAVVPGAPVTVAPIESSVADLPKYESQYVKVSNVQPVEAARGVNFYAGSASYATTKFETKTGGALDISIYKTNSWATTTVVPSNSGFVCGLVSIFNGVGQVAPRNAADVAGLNQPLFTVEAPEATKVTINEITAAGSYEVDATIVGVHQKGVMFADNAGGKNNFIMAFNNEWLTQTSNPCIGQINKKATVVGPVVDQYGLFQFTAPTITTGAANVFDLGTPTAFDAPAIIAYADAIKADQKASVYKYIKTTAELTIASASPEANYTTYTLGYKDALTGSIVKSVTLAYGLDTYFTGIVSGATVNVEGFALGFDTKKGNLNIMLTKISADASVPFISTTEKSVNFVNTGEAKTVAFTTGNIGSNKVFAKIEGTDAAQFSVPAGPVTSPVSVTAKANAEFVAKSATLVVYLAAAENGVAVDKIEVPLTQDRAVSGNEVLVSVDFSTSSYGIPTTSTDVAATFAVGDYTFGYRNAKSYATSAGAPDYLMLASKSIENSYFSTPIIAGKKLVKLVITNKKGAAAKAAIAIYPMDITTPVAGGVSQTWPTVADASDITFDLTDTAVGTAYRIYAIKGNNTQVTKMILTYEE